MGPSFWELPTLIVGLRGLGLGPSKGFKAEVCGSVWLVVSLNWNIGVLGDVSAHVWQCRDIYLYIYIYIYIHICTRIYKYIYRAFKNLGAPLE